MLDDIRRLGADASEVYEEKTFYRRWVEGVITLRVEKGCALRVLKSNRLIFLSAGSLESLFSRLKSVVRKLEDFPRQSPNFPRVYDAKRAPTGYDPSLNSSTYESRLEALSYQTPMPFTEYLERVKEVALTNSEGLQCVYRCSYFELFSPALGWIQKRSFQDLLKASRSQWSADGGPSQDAGDKRQEAIPQSTIHSPFLLSPQAVIQILQVTAGQFYGGSHPPEQVSTEFTLLDDGTLPGGWGTEPADGEGAQPQKTLLYQDGQLQDLLNDGLTGNLYKHRSTGNCRRENYQTPPRLGVTNLLIPPSTVDYNLFIEGEKELPVVQEFTTLRFQPPDLEGVAVWQVSRYGEFTKPLYATPIHWNFPEWLKHISARLDDFHLQGHFGSPSLLMVIPSLHPLS